MFKSMQNKVIAIILLFLGCVGCASKQTYIGKVFDCQNNPIAQAEIEAWKNQWIPFHLPLKLGETKSDENGTFILTTEKSASFFTYSGHRLVVTSHPKKSEEKCSK